MNNFLKSKIMAWVLLLILIAVLVVSFTLRPAWWALIDEFFAFMMAFCHLAAVYANTRMPAVSSRLDFIALVCGALAILSFIGEYIAYGTF